MIRWIKVLLLLLVSAGALSGCGDTREEYVFTGTANTATTGSLTFNFNGSNLPANVQQLLFDFYTGPNGTGNLTSTATRPYAGSVTIEQVPGNAQSVVITGFNADGEPVATIVAPVTVQVGGNRVIDLSNATVTAVTLNSIQLTPENASVNVGGTQQYTVTGTFSNGQTIAIEGVTFNANGPATIDANGLATGTGDGTATITATRGNLVDTATLEVNAVQPPDGLQSISVSPETLPLEVGQTGQLTTTGTFTDPNDNRELTANDALTYTSNNPAVATVDSDGTVTAVGIGQAIITAQSGNFTDTTTVNVTPDGGNNTNPVVTLDSTAIDYERGTAAVVLTPGATVTDDAVNLAGGTLTISTPDGSGVLLDAPNAPDIGTVTGDGTNNISVALDQGATPAAIQEFLRAVTISSSDAAAFGPQTVTVSLNDGQGGVATDTRTFNIQNTGADTITVGQGVNDDFTTIQAAVDSLANNATGAGSVITVAAGDYTAEGPIEINDSASLQGLTLRGPNAGISIGATPGTRVGEATVAAFSVDNRVVIDGFEITGDYLASPNAEVGVYFDADSDGSSLLNNDIDQVAPIGDPNVDGDSRGVITALGGVDNLTLSNNRFADWNGGTFLQGTALDESTGHVVSGNAYDGNNVNASNDSIGDTQYTGNVFGNSAGDEAIGIGDAGTGILINGNDIAAGDAISLFASPGAVVDAQNNYWGQATGPTAGQVNPDGGTIDTDPFLTADPFPTQP